MSNLHCIDRAKSISDLKSEVSKSASHLAGQANESERYRTP